MVAKGPREGDARLLIPLPSFLLFLPLLDRILFGGAGAGVPVTPDPH